MILHLSDLDELCHKVRNIYSKKYLEEAIASYRTGAYRAAIITTWVGVCVDIIEKVRELSISGDSLSKSIEDRLNKIQPNNITEMLAFEKEILDIACDQLELISVIEKGHLERLKNDRNLCAHPTFSIDGVQFNPSPELTRSYIVHAANYLLINAPVKGKVIIERLFELVHEESFPDDDEKAYAVLSSDNYLGKVRESSIRNFTIILLKRLFKDDDELQYKLLIKISVTLGVIERINPMIYKEVINSKLNTILAETNDKQLKRVLPFLIKRNDLWNKIQAAIIIRIEGLIAAMSVEEFTKYRVLQLASLNSQINSVVQSQIEKYDYDNLNKLLKASPSIVLSKHAIDQFIKSGSFDSANRNGTEIILPHSEFFNDSDMKLLLDGILLNKVWNINQILNASGIEDVLCQLYQITKKKVIKHAILWKDFFISVSERNYEYVNLKELLISDTLITPDVENSQNDNDDGIPF
jgi:hypothetical protein